MEDIKKDLRHEQEKAKAAKLQANKDDMQVGEMERSLKARDDNLSVLEENNRKLSQTSSQVLKELAEFCRLE